MRLSAQPPDPYGNRFIKFMKEVFEVDTKSIRKDQDQDMQQLRHAIMDFIKLQIKLKIKDIFSKNNEGQTKQFIERLKEGLKETD